MKATITVESAQNKIDLLISIAQEMGISVISTDETLSSTGELTHVSSSSLSEAWDSEEDKRWDELYKHTK